MWNDGKGACDGGRRGCGLVVSYVGEGEEMRVLICVRFGVFEVNE